VEPKMLTLLALFRSRRLVATEQKHGVPEPHFTPRASQPVAEMVVEASSSSTSRLPTIVPGTPAVPTPAPSTPRGNKRSGDPAQSGSDQNTMQVSGPTSPAPARSRDWEAEGEGAAKKWKPRGDMAGTIASMLEFLDGEVPDSRVVDYIFAAVEWCAPEASLEQRHTSDWMR